MSILSFRLCQRLPSNIFQARRYAATAAAKSVKRPPPRIAQAGSKLRVPNPSPNAPRLREALSPEQAKKQYAAKRIYEQGVHSLYRAPSHFGVLSVSWLIGTTFVGATAALGWLGHWKEEANEGFSALQSNVLSAGYRLGMILFTCVGVVAVLRYKGLVTALDLVPHQDVIQLRVKVRRAIPFLKPKEYIVPTYDFRLPYRWILPIQNPAWLFPEQKKGQVDLNPFRAVSKALFYTFKAFRTFILRDGIMRVSFQEADRTALLDANGWFSNDARDFLEVTTTERPWDSA